MPVTSRRRCGMAPLGSRPVSCRARAARRAGRQHVVGARRRVSTTSRQPLSRPLRRSERRRTTAASAGTSRSPGSGRGGGVRRCARRRDSRCRARGTCATSSWCAATSDRVARATRRWRASRSLSGWLGGLLVVDGIDRRRRRRARRRGASPTGPARPSQWSASARCRGHVLDVRHGFSVGRPA